MVVIAIIGVLSAVVVSAVDSARAKARDAYRKSEILEVQKALDMYYSDHGSYPTGYYSIFYWANQWATLLSPSYISAMPVDPLGWYDSGKGCDTTGDDVTTRGDFYVGSADGQHYFLGTSVENMPSASDPHYFYLGVSTTTFSFLAMQCVAAAHWAVQE